MTHLKADIKWAKDSLAFYTEMSEKYGKAEYVRARNRYARQLAQLEKREAKELGR